MKMLLLFACVCVSGVLEVQSSATELIEATTYKPIDFELFDLDNFTLTQTKEQRLAEQERKRKREENQGGFLRNMAMFLLIWFLAES